MIIGVSSSKKTGKTTFINDFKQKWPAYTSPATDYRDLKLDLVNDGARDRPVENPDLTPEERQRQILDFMIDDLKANYDREKCIIHDHTTIDNLAYTMWLYRKGQISDEFLAETFEKVKDSTHYYDIILFIPIWGEKGDVDFKDIPEGIDLQTRADIDEILKALYSAYHTNLDYKSDFWAESEAAVAIEIYGSREARLFLMDAYLDDDGQVRAKDAATILDSLGRGISSKDLLDVQDSSQITPTIHDFK